MALLSAWAYHNGKREMAKTLDSLKSEKTGWINGKYAERGYGDKLWIKGYANKTQCRNKIEKLIADGIDCEMSSTHPFTINKVEDDFDEHDFDNCENVHEKDYDEDFEDNRIDDSRNM